MQVRVLLDFDGVIYHNHIIHRIIKHKTIQFLQMKLNLKYHEALHLNDIEYPTKGHSALIVDQSEQTVYDYNQFVFTDELMNDIYKHQTMDDVRRIRELHATKDTKDLELILCSNAPLRYCEHVIESTGIPFDMLFSINHIYTSDRLHSVKPTDKYYSQVEQELENTIHFIDDSSMNLQPLYANPRWKPQLYADQDVHWNDFCFGTKGIRTPADIV